MINAGTVTSFLELDTSRFSASLRGAGAQLSAFSNSSNSLSSRITNLGGAISGVGASLTKGLTVPLVGVGALFVKTASDFEASMSKVKALSGATGKDFDMLKDKALEMGSKTQFSASESAQALQYMSLAGWETKQMLDGLPGVLDLAASAGMDLGQASDILTDTMSAFAMKAEEATHAADVFAYAQANANTDVSQLGEAFKYVSASSHAMGYDLEDTTAILEALANQGLKGSVAGTTLNAVFRDMKKNSHDGAISIGKQNIAIVDSNGNYRDMMDIMSDVNYATKDMTMAQKDAALGAIFGTRAIKGVNMIMTEGTDTIKTYEAELRNSNGYAKETAEIMNDNLKGAFTKLKSALEGMAISLGNVLIPMIKDLVQKINDWVDWFNSLNDSTKETIVKVGLVVASLGPLLLILGNLISAGGIVFGTIGKIAGSMGLLGGSTATATTATGGLAGAFTFLTGPIGLTIAAIAGLIAIFVTLYKKSETFRNYMNNLGSDLKNFAASIPAFFADLPGNLEAIGKNIIIGLGNGILSMINYPFEVMDKITGGLITRVKKSLGIHSPSRVMIEFGKYIDEGLAKGMEDNKDDVLKTATNIAKGIEDSIKTNVKKIEGFGKQVVTALKNQYKDLERTQIESINKTVKAEEEASNKRLKKYNDEYMQKLKLIDKEAYDKTKDLQEQIDSIDAKTKREEEELRKQEQLKKQIRLEAAVDEAKSDEERKKAKEELNIYLLELEREKILEQREIKKVELEEEMESINQKAEKTKESLTKEYEDKKANEEAKLELIKENAQIEIDLVKEHYSALSDAYALENEAIRLMTQENQEELITLLSEYNPKWQDAGQSFSDKLLNGLNSNKETIKECVDEMIDIAPHIKDQEKALKDLNKVIDKLEEKAKKVKDSGKTIGSGLGAIGEGAKSAEDDLKKLEEATNNQTDANEKLADEMTNNTIPKVALFSEEISKSTQEAVGSYMNLDTQAGQSLMNLNLTSEKVSGETALTLTKTFSDMGEQIKTSLDTKYNESYSIMENFFKNSDTLTEQEEKEALKKLKENHEKKKEETDAHVKKIEKILKEASKNNRELTKEEQEEINKIQEEMKQNAIDTLTENETEANTILDRMKKRAGSVTAEQAAEVVKNAKQQKDETVKKAEEQYQKVVKELEKQRDETGTISDEQCAKLKLNADIQCMEQKTKAEQAYKSVVESAQAQAAEHVDHVNWETGEVLSEWEYLTLKREEEFKKRREESDKHWEETKEKVKGSMKNIDETISNGLEGIRTWATDHWSKMTGLLSNPISSAFDEIDKWTGKICKAVGKAIDKIKKLMGFQEDSKSGGGSLGGGGGGFIGPSTSTNSSSSGFVGPSFSPSSDSGYARGTNNATRGWHWVGEQGPELRYFNGGETVINSAKSLEIASNLANSNNLLNNASNKTMNTFEIDYEKLGQVIARNSKDINVNSTFYSPDPLTPNRVRENQEQLLRDLEFNLE